MAEVKNSKTLDRILNRIEETSRRNYPLTAQKFLLGLFDEIILSDKLNGELRKSKKMLDSSHINIIQARKNLSSYLKTQDNANFAQFLFMDSMIFNARMQAAENGSGELTTDILLDVILKNIDDSIKSMLFQTSSDNDTAAGGGIDIPDLEPDFSDLDALLFGSETDFPGLEPDPFNLRSEENHEGSLKSGIESGNPKTAIAALVAETERIGKELRKSVYGQDNAINLFLTGYFHANMLSLLGKNEKGSHAAFLFAGPPGVGKTFLAETIAKTLKLPFARFDMSEYSDKEANLEFCGSDKVYKAAKEGNVTGFVAKHKKCVLLFDEIEKAHLCVIHLFLQILDAGRLRDNFTDEEVSFSDAIIIFTTNAGHQLYEENENTDMSSYPRKVIIHALENDLDPRTQAPYFPASICSRFAAGNLVAFNHMDAHSLLAISRNQIEKQAECLENKSGIKFQIDKRVYSAILFSEGIAADARTIKSRAESFFNDELYELLRLVLASEHDINIEQIENIRILPDLSKADKEIRSLFKSDMKPHILMLSDAKIADRFCRDYTSFEVTNVQNLSEAIDAFKENDFDFALLELQDERSENPLNLLNIEDVESPARDLLKFLHIYKKDLPIYLLKTDGIILNAEEELSFKRQGVRDILRLDTDKQSLNEQLAEISESIYQQACMKKLGSSNKCLSFETAQTISEDGKNAEIRLFDFRTATAVDAEDKKNIMSSVSKPDVHFNDVIGAEDAKRELTYFVEYLKNPKKYIGTGVKAPKGVLLYGPPGTGKTMLAKAMACESDVTFIAAEGNQFLKKYVGEGPETVHALFRVARKYAPSILFIDEIDAIARERRGYEGNIGGEETLTAFLAEMDGFANDPTKPVFVLAATNFSVEPGESKSLDPALMRRFDRRVYIDLPNRENRTEFINRKINDLPALDISEKETESIALRSVGMSLANMDSIIELALRLAIRAGKTKVTDEIFEDAFETFCSGDVKKWDTSQLERVARHEAGHALLCWMSGEKPSYLTIVARGDHAGYMQHGDTEDKGIYTKDELISRIRTSLGGRAAELVYYGERDGVSTGVSGDLAAATNLAQRIICSYGMDDSFGLAVVNTPNAAGGEVSLEVRRFVNRILNEQMAEAVRIISENKDKIDSLVNALMLKSHLNRDEIEQAILKCNR